MAKIVFKKTTMVFTAAILVLMGACIGLLVALLKSQQQSGDPSTDSGFISATPPDQTTTVAAPPSWNTHFRLTSQVEPLHYDLYLKPDLDPHAMKFSGHVKIKVNAKEATKYFVVHKSKLDIEVAEIRTAVNGTELEVAETSFYEKTELYVMELKEEAPIGEYELYFQFRGSLNGGNIVGFYSSSYTDPQGGKKFLATSKFQPTYARRAFPCFDEPSFKSNFTVTLDHQPEYKTILSNMPVQESEVTKDGRVITKFEESVPMVTYLVCFIVCDFGFEENKFESEGKNKTFRVFASPHQVEKTKFALEVGVDVINYYEKYFEIGYPLPKQDMIAIPDFSSGAMEHWGLITFRETNLLYDKEMSSSENKQRVAIVIAHELAHMWFGNLVTMEWWDNLWLNEGFASYMEYKAVDHRYPEWHMLEQFLTSDLQPVMLLDATNTSHPIIQNVISNDEITEIFDTISYNKGAAVLRMLEFFVGHKEFAKGISNYLKKYEYKTARTEQLWAEMSTMTREKYNISEIMDTWTKQMGFPYVNVNREQVESSTNFTVSQKRFLINPEMEIDYNSSDYKYVWKIPLSYVTCTEQSGIVWLNSNENLNFNIDNVQADCWVKFNRNQTGYYLVNYQKEEWKRIIDILRKNHTEFTPSDRANFLFDAFQLAENGVLEYDIPLEMTNYLVNETDLTPWETAYNSIVRLGHILENTAEGYALKDHVKKLSADLYEELGWNKTTDNHINSLLQSTIVGLACYSGNEHCIQEAVEKLDEWATKRTTDVPLNLKRVVLHYGMSKSGSEKTWDTFWSMYMDEKSAQERVTLLYGLAHTDQVKMIDRLLTYASDTISNKIKSQDFFTVLTYIAGNPVGRPIVWDYVRKNWAQLVKRFSLNDRYLGRAVKSICDYFTTEKELQTMKDFFGSTDPGAGAMARNQTLQNVRNNIRWLKMNKDSVGKFFKMPWNNYRLSKSVIPIHYHLLLHPNLITNQFEGHVTILVKITEAMKYLVLHSKNLEIIKTEVRNKLTGKVVPSRKSVLYEANEFLVTPLKETTEVDQEYELYYEFKGMLNGSLVGFYKSSYVFRFENGTEETRHLATSQFQSTYARQAFPCFDEPNFKSTFNVILVHPEELIALSNMPVKEIIDVGGVDKLRATHFETSVKMVTYLVAVIVCDFKYQEGKTTNNKMVRVYAAPHQVDQAKYALDVAIKTLQYYDDYFGIVYPLPKLDMIAIPDFRAGAMENWGLVTYRETNLLYKEGTTPAYNQLRIGAVIGHELAHMWFGNLVTMKWWNDLWLNEGFASYIEYKSMEHVDPSWQVDSQFFLEDMQRVVVRDATHESHPIVQEVGHPDQISELFDVISYSKGASVLRMLEFFMGTSFQKGVSKYLETYSYQNTETADLWKILQDFYKDVGETDSSNIPDIMDTWTRQMGYPCISIQRSENDVFKVSQNRFLLDSNPNLKDVSPLNYVWKVPLSFITADNSTPSIVWLNDANTDVKINVANESTWVKFNADHKGYYVVDYKEEWDKLIAILDKDHKKLTPSDRSNLISDAFLLARAGLMNYSKALDLSTYLTKESDFVPWASASSSLSYIADLLEEPSQKNNEIKNYLDNLSVGQVKALQWEDIGDHLTKRLRATVISVSCKSGNVNCWNGAQRELTYWLENKPISPNLKNTIFCYGMKQMGNESVWDQMWKRYLAESSSQERVMLLNGLSCTTNKDLLERFMDLAWSESNVRSQDYFNVLSNIASNPEGLEMVWKFFRDNWTKLVQRFTINSSYLGGAIKNICRHFKTEERLKEMEKFFNENKEAGAGVNARKEALETVQGNIKWIETHKSEVTAWLKEKNKPFHNVRLPRYIVPKEYEVRLQPDLDSGTFNGSVTITVQLKKPSKFFVVHIESLNITDKTRVTRGGTEIKIIEEFPVPKNEYWVLEMEHEVEEGDYKLEFCFIGTMKGLTGFYRSTYKNSQNETRNIATSQFQPTHARRAFPCFDEPSFKSHFIITLVHPKGYIALSNMPPREDHKNKLIANGLLETKFEKTTKPMVTYLVCVIVCDFTERSVIGGNKNIPIRVYASPESVHLTQYALDAGKAVLETLEKYFKIDYPLPKLDMIAIPDFRAGAMENWGLITYREIYMLFDKDKTPPSTQFSIYMIIAHEIAHMWFGNLVTMEWWDDLWLNEGFATYMAYKVTTMNNKDWNGEGHFMLKEMNNALRVDGTKQSNPIVRIVNFPHEISATFDSVTYGKGGSVLRMIETFVEENNFQAGLQKYLNKYADKNAVTDDLWAELKDVSNELIDVKGIMNTWTRQMGYPVIWVTNNQNNKTATVEQKRFLLNPNSTMEESHVSPYRYIWKVPLEYTCIKNNRSEKMLMMAVKEEINLSNCSDTSQIKWNSNQKAYYLINYDILSWKKWATDLTSNYKTLSSSLDRSNILNDAFLLAHSGALNYDLLLGLTKYLKSEDDYVPWNTAGGGLLEILRFLEGNNEASNKMKSYIRDLANKQMEDLQWNDNPDETLNKRLLRSTIINLACAAEDSSCLEEASRLLKEFLDEGKILPTALKSQVYRYGLSNSSDPDTWDKLWNRYQNETSAQEQRDLLYGMAFTNSPEKLKEYIVKAEKEVRQQDFFTVINYISSNPKGLSITWDYVKNEWPNLVERFTLQDSGLGGMVKTVTSKFTTQEKLDEVKEFFAKYPDAGAGASGRKAALEIIDGNIRWKNNYEKIVADWLNSHSSS